MSYAELVEPDVAPDGQIALHVPDGLGGREVAAAAYSALRRHGELELVVADRSVGVLSMARVRPLLLTVDGAVRGGPGVHAAESGPAGVTRRRCAGCGATAYVLGAAVVECRAPGHGPMAPVPAEVAR